MPIGAHKPTGFASGVPLRTLGLLSGPTGSSAVAPITVSNARGAPKAILTESGNRNNMKIGTAASFTIALLALGSLLHLNGAKPARLATLYIQPPPLGQEADEREFRGLLKAELSKRKGVIPISVTFTSEPKQADMLLEVFQHRRAPKWHEGFLTPAKASARITVIGTDHCGQVLFTKIKGDMTLFGPAGLLHSVQMMALSLKEGLHKKNSRINKTRRERPCVLEEGEWVVDWNPARQ